jgi:L-ascorbate metabolism protein UlaG (beta-lactamase superfamily)
VNLTYVGGPTALIEVNGLRFLTDPTFDPASADYPSGASVLRKLKGPVRSAESLGRVDAVLLSHDHHSDNLDRSGREFLTSGGKVITTAAGTERLDGNAVGLEPWQSINRSAEGKALKVTATPARHGPAHMDRGPILGFVITAVDEPENSIYFSGGPSGTKACRKSAAGFRSAPRC